MNDLLVTTSLNNTNKLLYATEVRTHINGAPRETVHYRPDTTWWHRDMPKSTRRDYVNFFDKYIYPSVKFGRKYRTYSGTIQHHVEFDMDDPFKELLSRRVELKLKHFLRFGSEVFYPRHIPANITKLFFELDFVEVNESIISYLFQIGEPALAKALQAYFSNVSDNHLSIDENLTRKARELLALDLDGLNQSIRGGKN